MKTYSKREFLALTTVPENRVLVVVDDAGNTWVIPHDDPEMLPEIQNTVRLDGLRVAWETPDVPAKRAPGLGEIVTDLLRALATWDPTDEDMVRNMTNLSQSLPADWEQRVAIIEKVPSDKVISHRVPQDHTLVAVDLDGESETSAHNASSTARVRDFAGRTGYAYVLPLPAEAVTQPTPETPEPTEQVPEQRAEQPPA